VYVCVCVCVCVCVSECVIGYVYAKECVREKGTQEQREKESVRVCSTENLVNTENHC